MKYRLNRLVWMCALLVFYSPLHATGILVIGDSWAKPIVTPLQEVLAEHGHTDITVEYSDTAVWARDLASPQALTAISNWLNDHPDTNIVQLTIGSNDWEWGDNGKRGTYWEPSWAGTQKEIDMCEEITNWIATAADRFLSVRPEIQVVWTGYDFFRPLDSGTPAQRNATLILLANLAKKYAETRPGVTYVDTNGLMQVTYGFDGVKHTQYDPAVLIPPGDPSLPDAGLPSPVQSFRAGDKYHLTAEGFKVLAQEQYNQAYSHILESAVFQINAGLNDAWYDPDTAGQGMLLTVFPDITQIFLAWFTFDAERPDESITTQFGDPGHRWLTAQGTYADNQAVLDLFSVKGGVFDTPLPAPVSENVGTLVVEFSDCNSGTVSYELSSGDRKGVIPIERIALDNIPLCESLNEQLQQNQQ